MQNLVYCFSTMCMHVTDPKNFVRRWGYVIWDAGHCWPRRNAPLHHVYYRAKFGCSRLNHMDVVRVTKILWSLGTTPSNGAWMAIHRNMSPRCDTMPTLVTLIQNVCAYVGYNMSAALESRHLVMGRARLPENTPPPGHYYYYYYCYY